MQKRNPHEAWLYDPNHGYDPDTPHIDPDSLETPETDPNDPRPFHVRASERLDAVFGPPAVTAPKLTHEGHCQVYACLYMGIPQYIVAKAFDLSAPTVSLIAGCRQDRREPVTLSIDDGTRVHNETNGTRNLTRTRNLNRKPKYQAVEEEFESLGEPEFMRRYYTPHVDRKIMWAKSQIKTRVWLD